MHYTSESAVCLCRPPVLYSPSMNGLRRTNTSLPHLCPLAVALIAALFTWRSCCPLLAAQVMTVAERSDREPLAVATWDHGNTLLALQTNGSQYRAPTPGGHPAEALSIIKPFGVVVFCGGQAFLLSWADPTLEYTLVRGGPIDVRSIVGVGDNRFVAISGGHYTDSLLKGAYGSLWELQPHCRKLCDAIPAQVNPQSVTAGSLGDNAVGDNDCVLFSVYKSAILDPTVRLRPWLYHVAGERLAALWQGSSFSQPHLAVAFADLCRRNSGDEVCALELARDGQRQITVYRWHGFIMEGIARSKPGPFGNSLRAASLGTEAGEAIFTWRGADEGSIIGLTAAEWPEGELASLRQCASTEQMPRPLAWDIGSIDGKPVAFVLTRDGVLRAVPIRSDTPK